MYGQDKLDEISMCAPTTVCDFHDGEYVSYYITPETFGLESCDQADLRGGTPQENARITRAILSGQERGPKRSAVLLNGGAALYIARKAQSLTEGIQMAGELIDSGAAARKLEQFIDLSNRLGAEAQAV